MRSVSLTRQLYTSRIAVVPLANSAATACAHNKNAFKRRPATAVPTVSSGAQRKTLSRYAALHYRRGIVHRAPHRASSVRAPGPALRSVPKTAFHQKPPAPPPATQHSSFVAHTLPPTRVIAASGMSLQLWSIALSWPRGGPAAEGARCSAGAALGCGWAAAGLHPARPPALALLAGACSRPHKPHVSHTSPRAHSHYSPSHYTQTSAGSAQRAGIY